MMSNARRLDFAPHAALLLALSAFALSACSSTVDMLPEKMGGLPTSAPQRPAETMAYPNVYEPRPVRADRPLNGNEQKKLESELTTLREGLKQRAGEPYPPPPPPKKPAAQKKPAADPKAKKAAADKKGPADPKQPAKQAN